MTDEELKSGINAIQEFYINNPKVDEINKYFRRLNVFRILGIETMEIKHSNMLAWLMNPNENHALGDKFFKRLMLEIIKACGGRVASGSKNSILTYSDISCNSFSDLIIRREWFNIDLLAISKSNQIVVLIENKIYASESKNENGISQLDKYVHIVNREFSDEEYPKKVYVFLTLDGKETKYTSSESDIEYSLISYQAVYDSIKNLLNSYCDEINPKKLILSNNILKSWRDCL